MNISIVLIAYLSDKWLPSCLASLASASKQSMHLILIDNAHNTLIDQVDFSSFQTEIIKTPHPMGFAEANNFALINASHLNDTVLFLNQDTISQPYWIDNCLKILEKKPRIGAISPIIRNYNNTKWDPSFLDCLPNRAAPNPTMEDLIFAQNAPAPALIVRTQVLSEIGPFDPIFGSYYEDYDLCRRIRKKEYQIAFYQKAVIQHFSGSATNTPEKERRRMRVVQRNRFIYNLRASNNPRWLNILKHFLLDFPHRLARGIFNTTSSQPPMIVLKANLDILKLLPRLLFTKRDEAAWIKYLQKLGWNKK